MATPIPPNRAALTAWEIAAASGGRIVRETDERLVARGFTTDSRAVTEGGGFVALRGERLDGHDFVEKAEELGATLVVVERGEGRRARRACVVEVDDTLLAWGAIERVHLARWRAADPRRRVIAITASVPQGMSSKISGTGRARPTRP